MALDSTPGSPAADSYVSLDDFKAYAAARGYTAIADQDDELTEAALRRATSYLDGRYRGRWKGVKASQEQSLAWPRAGVRDEDGYAIDDDLIPRALKQATFEAALRESTSPYSLIPEISAGGIKREKVGPIEIEYMDGSTGGVRPDFVAIDDSLSGLLDGYGGSSGVVFLDRA